MSKVLIPSFSYKNKTANTISHLGTTMAAVGITMYSFGNVMGSEMVAVIGGILTIIGLPCIGIVWLVMQKKRHDMLMQMIREKNLEPLIASSTKDAIELYKLVPSYKLEKYIARLKPEAGKYIAKNRANLR